MTLGILVDASCDLPTSIYERYQVNILPATLMVNQQLIIDARDPETTQRFYRSTSAQQLASARPDSATVGALIDALKASLLYRYDQLLIVTPHLKLSNTLPRVRETVFQIQPQFEPLRLAAQLTHPYKVRILESNSGYAGYGLVLYEALRLIKERARSVDQLKQPLDDFKSSLVTYVLPGHERFNYELLANPPFNLSWLSLQKLKLTTSLPVFKIDFKGANYYENIPSGNAERAFLHFAYQQLMGTRLSSHLVNISFAGNLAKLRVLPMVKTLQKYVISQGGKLVYSMMSLSSAAQLGKGALSLSFAAAEQLPGDTGRRPLLSRPTIYAVR
ncbi:DegV family protein [Reinekea sp.]|jgi:fatty acid-binding protein DegV|uniref:DegV family protein n=1 Tax=Reinekea sp. TaxID=1970455 RepID=UPI002A7EEEA1|nr:DegV family protein [Reinekea sp.]